MKKNFLFLHSPTFGQHFDGWLYNNGHHFIFERELTGHVGKATFQMTNNTIKPYKQHPVKIVFNKDKQRDTFFVGGKQN